MTMDAHVCSVLGLFVYQAGAAGMVARGAVGAAWPPPLAEIRSRQGSLMAARLDSAYQRGKASDWSRFREYLASSGGVDAHGSLLTTDTCGPQSVMDYLVSCDVFGKTVVHRSRDCEGYLPSRSCDCPRRLAWGTVDSMIGRLRSSFLDSGRSGQDNPAGHRSVMMLLQDLKSEQLSAGIAPVQAKPLFSRKLRVLSLEMLKVLRSESMEPGTRFAVLRARAMLLLDAHSLKRGSELGQTLVQSVLRMPDDSGMLFNYVWGKTLRSGSAHVFGVLRLQSDAEVMCPIVALDAYVRGAEELGVSLSGPDARGYLFRPWRGPGAPVGDTPLSASQLGSDLSYWLSRCNINNGETMHGLRSGGAIEAAIRGSSLSQVMDRAFWRSTKTAAHYMKFWQVLSLSVAGASAPVSETGGAEGSVLSASEYEALDSLAGFFRAF